MIWVKVHKKYESGAFSKTHFPEMILHKINILVRKLWMDATHLPQCQ
jgi:hypothetical protein